MSQAERIALLAAERPALLRMIQKARCEQPDKVIVAYLITVREPSGYLLAIALQRRLGHPGPELLLFRALSGHGPPQALMRGVVSATELVALLTDLSPNLSRLAADVPCSESSSPPIDTLSVLVAAGGGAEVFVIPAAEN
ncbi:hypothetical protein [Chondromyces crocatus]|uniref:Uncharacterized protein n=1 Tax=Chondromyces crocatus TaxID=52 RepID=A0A0K1EQI7_CHOCO|nr:hypothetical protein [Chondromyces crocatus]AKT42922.1 uncharacterized protein CMC5_071500 [Chondromyces crocatus]